MAVAHVQSAANHSGTSNVTVTLSSAPTVGNMMVLIGGTRSGDPDAMSPPTGWTAFPTPYNTTRVNFSSTGVVAWYREVQSGDGTSYQLTTDSSFCNAAIVEVSGSGTPVWRWSGIPRSGNVTEYHPFGGGTVDSASYVLEALFYTGSTGISVQTNPTGFTLASNTGGAPSYTGLAMWYRAGGATSLQDPEISTGSSTGLSLAIEFPESGTTVPAWDGVRQVTVASSGGDYTDMASAVADTNMWGGIYQIAFDDSAAFTSSSGVYLDNITQGSTYRSENWLSEDFYLHFTATPGNRHSGVPGTGHARLTRNDGNPVIRLRDDFDYTRISHLELQNTYPYTVTKEVVRLEDATQFVLIDNCILRGTSGASSGDHGVDLSNNTGAGSARVSNCVILDCGAAFYLNPRSSSVTVYADHCSVYDCHHVFRSNETTYLTSTIYAYNVASGNTGVSGGTVYWCHPAQPGTQAINGSHNCYDSTNLTGLMGPYITNNLTNTIEVTSTTTTTTTSDAFIVTDLTSPNYNLLPVQPTGSGANDVLAAGTNRIGSEPDGRQDFSVDIRGVARVPSKTDIGAFQISTAAGFKYWDGSAWADSTNVQYWNGSAWVDVNAIQYWNGSAWTDPS